MATIKRSKIGGGKSGLNPEVRRALMDAALELMERGEAVTIAATAKCAGISPATAYRYFSDPATLMIKAFQDRQLLLRNQILHELEHTFADIDDVEERVLIVHGIIYDFVLCHERASRLFLAKNMELRVYSGYGEEDFRGARRPKMFELALAPVQERLGKTRVADLNSALSAASGLEAFIVLKDICHRNNDEIDEIMRSNLLAILRAGLADKT
jgi:AcrR family transcriptional regulator